LTYYNRGIIVHCEKPIERILWCSIKLERPIKPQPGQFIMLWVPDYGEIPLSISDYNEDRNILELIIARVGKVTSYIHETYTMGTYVTLRGPYGKGFSIVKNSKCLIIAGGSGLAPFPLLIRRLLQEGSSVDVLVGFRTLSEIFHIDKLRKLAENVYVATDDGSYGLKGTIPEVLTSNIITVEDYDIVYTCGKEIMMSYVVRHCYAKRVRCEASLERYMKCGIGLCGACVLDPLGLRVCKDGPVFPDKILLKLEDFGNYWRDFCGRKVKLP